MQSKKTAVSLAIGSAILASFAIAPVASGADNPFKMDSLKDGYQVVAAKKSNEGKCGEGKCGARGSNAKTKSGERSIRG